MKLITNSEKIKIATFIFGILFMIWLSLTTNPSDKITVKVDDLPQQEHKCSASETQDCEK